MRHWTRRFRSKHTFPHTCCHHNHILVYPLHINIKYTLSTRTAPCDSRIIQSVIRCHTSHPLEKPFFFVCRSGMQPNGTSFKHLQIQEKEAGNSLWQTHSEGVYCIHNMDYYIGDEILIHLNNVIYINRAECASPNIIVFLLLNGGCGVQSRVQMSATLRRLLSIELPLWKAYKVRVFIWNT